MKYSKCISIGHACQPANYIRKLTTQQEAHFFDWLVTPTDSLLKLIEQGPESLFYDRAQFVTVDEPNRKNATVTHKGLGVVLYHEFPCGPHALNSFDKVTLKYRHLAQRWHALSLVRNKTLFIRHYAGKDDALLIQKGIRKAFPQLPFDILAVNEDEANVAPWNLPGIINMCVNPTGADWRGDSVGWTNVFKTVVI